MGFKQFNTMLGGARLDFDTICMGFKTLVLGCVGIYMGFKRSHQKTHANSIRLLPPTLKTHANSSKSL